MSRIVRFLILAGAAPVGITYQTCAFTDHGFSVLPNIGRGFAINDLLGTFGL
jgi:hypothetical protein